MPKGTCNVRGARQRARQQLERSGLDHVHHHRRRAGGRHHRADHRRSATGSTVATAPRHRRRAPSLRRRPTDDESTAPKVGGPLGLSRLVAALGLAVLLGSIVLIVTAWPEGVEYILTVRFLRIVWIVGRRSARSRTAIFLTAQITGPIAGRRHPADRVDRPHRLRAGHRRARPGRTRRGVRLGGRPPRALPRPADAAPGARHPRGGRRHVRLQPHRRRPGRSSGCSPASPTPSRWRSGSAASCC